MEHCRSPIVRSGPASAGLMAEPRACGSPLPLSPTNRNNGGPERIRTFDLCLRRVGVLASSNCRQLRYVTKQLVFTMVYEGLTAVVSVICGLFPFCCFRYASG